MLKAAIVILNYNGQSWLEKFLPSVVKNSNYPIYIVDNGSNDNSLQFLKENYPQLSNIILPTNLGYAGGYNEALVQIDAEFLVLLNSDVEVTPFWDQNIINLMSKDPLIAACQPKIKSFSQKNLFEFAGAAGGFIDTFGYPFCRGRIFDTLEEDLGQYNDIIEIFWATGACLFLRKSAFIEADKFDTDFFAHMEEIDLCWRLKGLGYKVMYCAESEVYHVGGGTLQTGSTKKFYLNFRNSLWMLFKNLPNNELLPKLLIRLALDGIASIQFALRGRPLFLWIVLKAHLVFYANIPRLIRKRKEIWKKRKIKTIQGISPKSIVFDYFIRKKNIQKLFTN